MFNPLSQNELWLGLLEALVGADADLAPARLAFDTTPGDFEARFTAAVEALVARQVQPEVFIDIPAEPQKLSRAQLDALVRPVAAGFLRSQPTKSELLEQVERIRLRQERRPAWLPRADRDGRVVPPAHEAAPPRPTTLRAFPELGEVAIRAEAAPSERPELPALPGGLGELEVVLHTVLAVERGPAAVIRVDSESNEALIPGGGRWWSPEPAALLPAAQDPGVASELLATTATLGGVPVKDDAEPNLTALAYAADWRYGPRWLLDTWDHGSNVAALAAARAAVAGWADEEASGVVMVVYGGLLHGADGLFGVPGPLHSFVLCAARAGDGSDAVTSVHRVILSCPGGQWCHRGGCPVEESDELLARLAPVFAGAEAAEAAGRHADWATRAYQQLYGAGAGEPDAGSDVLDEAGALLTAAGWAELERSTWEGGLEDLLLRRGEHCLRASYDPVTRQLKLSDGRPWLEYLLESWADDDGPTGELLLAPTAELALPTHTQVTVVGLHPHGDGTLLAPEAPALAQRQLTQLLRTAGLA